MSSLAEMQDFERMFKAMEPHEREQLYGIRKAHKETSVFLHEWGHTLGAPHVEDPTRIMSPGYSQRTSLLSNEDAELISAALDSRMRSRGRETAAIDWSPLHQYLKDQPQPRVAAGGQADAAGAVGAAGGGGAGQLIARLPRPPRRRCAVPPPFGLRPLPPGGIPLPPPEAADRPAAAPRRHPRGGRPARARRPARPSDRRECPSRRSPPRRGR